MKPPPSLLARIVLRLSLATLAAIVCAYAVLWWQFQSITGALRETSLIESARAIARAVHIGADGTPVLDLPATMLTAYRESGGRDGFAVRDRTDGSVLFAAGAEAGPLPPIVADDEDGSLYQYNPDGPGPALFVGEALPFQAGDRKLAVQVIERSSDYEDLIKTILIDFFEDGGWMAGPFLLLLLLVSILTVHGTLRPLHRLSQRLEGFGPSTISQRLPLTDVPREILPLVKAVNDALERLEEGFRMERDFTTDAAHELRTPLAVLMAHVDTLSDRATAKALGTDIDAMAHLVDQLLRVARAEIMVVDADCQADLAGTARDVCAYLAPLAIRMGRSLEVEAPDQPIAIRGQGDAIFHAIRNLVDNALRHTPSGTTVTVTASSTPPRLSVRDHGPGVPPENRHLMFRRFWRANRRVSGAGLGLAIVQRTMQAHDGQVTYEDAPDGGAIFTLVFPEL